MKFDKTTPTFRFPHLEVAWAQALAAQAADRRASSPVRRSLASLEKWLRRCETEQDRFLLASGGELVHRTERQLPHSESALFQGDGEDGKKLQAMELRGPDEETGEEPEYVNHTYWVDKTAREPVAWREDRRLVRDRSGKVWLLCLIHQPRLVKTGRTVEVLVEADFECNPTPEQVAELVQDGWLRPVVIWATDSPSQFSAAELRALAL